MLSTIQRARPFLAAFYLLKSAQAFSFNNTFLLIHDLLSVRDTESVIGIEKEHAYVR